MSYTQSPAMLVTAELLIVGVGIHVAKEHNEI